MDFRLTVQPDRIGEGARRTVAIMTSGRDRDERLAGLLQRQGVRVAFWHEGDGPPVADLVIVGMDGPDAGRAEAIGKGLCCPVAILSGGCREQVFPDDPLAGPIRLRAPLSAVTARVLVDYIAARIPA